MTYWGQQANGGPKPEYQSGQVEDERYSVDNEDKSIGVAMWPKRSYDGNQYGAGQRSCPAPCIQDSESDGLVSAFRVAKAKSGRSRRVLCRRDVFASHQIVRT